MRIVFMGSAEFACPCLDRLLSSSAHTMAGIVTQPDRPKGRSLKTTPCPVRAHLENVSFPVLTPSDINTPDQVKAICELSPDLIIVVAYGQILKRPILEIPPKGCINVHASLLPKYRGAAPVQWAIARGEKTTGVTTMYLNEAMDEGDIIDQLSEPIQADDTGGTLHDRLAQRGADLLARTLEPVKQGTASGVPQVHEQATYAPRLKKKDGRMDWSLSATELNNRIRGFNPWPGCYFQIPGGMTLRVFKARIEQGTGVPGAVVEARGQGPLIQTGNQALRILELQPEGRKRMGGAAFLSGYSLKVGETL